MDRNRKLDLTSIMQKTHAYEKRKINLIDTILRLERENVVCNKHEQDNQESKSNTSEKNLSSYGIAAPGQSSSSSDGSITPHAVQGECPPSPKLKQARSRTGSGDTQASENCN